MDRRAFLTSAGAATAFAATKGFERSGKLYAQSSGGPDPNLVNAAGTNHTITTANSFNGNFLQSDWVNLRSVHAALRSNIVNNNLDSAFMAAAQSISSVDPSAIDMQGILSAIQIYQPDFQMSDLQNSFAQVPLDPDSLQQALETLQTSGLSPHLSRCVLYCNQMVQAFESGSIQASTMLNGSATPQNKIGPPSNGCATDSAAILAVGTAFAVIAFMAAPEIGVLALAFWGPMSFWGGTGVAVWGLGHVVMCPF